MIFRLTSISIYSIYDLMHYKSIKIFYFFNNFDSENLIFPQLIWFIKSTLLTPVPVGPKIDNIYRFDWIEILGNFKYVYFLYIKCSHMNIRKFHIFCKQKSVSLLWLLLLSVRGQLYLPRLDIATTGHVSKSEKQKI